jgi:hypothetical protein
VIGVFYLINLVLIDNFDDFSYFIVVHLTKVIFDLEIWKTLIVLDCEIKVIFILPLYIIELELFLSDDTFVFYSITTNNCKFVWRVHQLYSTNQVIMNIRNNPSIILIVVLKVRRWVLRRNDIWLWILWW